MDGEELGLLDDGAGGEGTELEEVETEPGTEGEPEGEPTGGEETPPDQETEAERPGDRRALPLQLRKALREVAAANPEFAKRFPRLEKQLSGALFKAGAIDRAGGMQRFQEYSELIEAHGGAEGIQELAEEVEASRVLEKGFEQGDPELIETWAKNYPAGFKSLLAPAIAKLDQMDQAAHDRVLAGPIVKIFDRCGVWSTLNALEATLGENPEAWKQFGLLKDFFGQVQSLSRKSSQRDPEIDERQARDAEYEERENKLFYGSVRQDVNSQVTALINRALRTELNGRKVRMDTGNRLRKEISSELNRRVNTAPGYAARYEAVMNRGDKDAAVRFITQAAKLKIPAVVKQLVREFNISGAGGNRNAGTGVRRIPRTGAVGGSNIIPGRPKTADIDFNRTDKARWLATMNSHGEAYLRNGKLAKW